MDGPLCDICKKPTELICTNNRWPVYCAHCQIRYGYLYGALDLETMDEFYSVVDLQYARKVRHLEELSAIKQNSTQL